MYRAQEFASLAGITVRALHHYDRLGLLKPKGRSAAGYRLYSDEDLIRLEQIAALKFFGFSLAKIRELLAQKLDLRSVLRLQRRVLEEKRRRLDRVIATIAKAEQSGAPDGALFREIIKEIQMQDETNWTERYYTEEARAKIEARKALWSPELQAEVSKQWEELFSDVEGALHEDPASPRVQALAARWKKLVEGFTGGDPGISAGLKAMYADRPNWPESAKAQVPFKPELMAFIGKAMAVGRG